MSLKMLTVPAEMLRRNPWNTNVVSPENERKIEESIKQGREYGGFFKPLVVREHPDGDGTYQILGGEHRFNVGCRLDIDEFPVANVGRVDDVMAKKIGLIDNARYGEDDALGLAELFKELGDPESLQSILPLSNDDLASIFATSTVALDDLDALDSPGAESEVPPTRKEATHQILRFKVPVADIAAITEKIETAMKRQGFTGDDSMMNAGNALVFLLNPPKD